jgi:ribonuclease-3
MAPMFGRRPTTPLEEQLGYRFRRPDLIDLAVTHRSHAHESAAPDDSYERLEFLGDAVLGMVAAEWLYRRHPDLPEGELSRRKSDLVSRPVLARHARRLALGGRLRLGVGEERSGGREKESLLADVLEAVYGAVFLDGGLPAARKLIHGHFEAAEAEAGERPFDAKTRLQELAQARGWALPVYRLVEESGPDHDKTFVVECLLEGDRAGGGTGRSKKLAEQAAAAEALGRLEGDDGRPGT